MSNFKLPMFGVVFFRQAQLKKTKQITCSWHQKNEFSNSPIHKFKVLHKNPKSLLKPLFNGVLVLIYYFKKHFRPCFFISKTFCSTFNWWIGELENWRIRGFVFWCHGQVTNSFGSFQSLPKRDEQDEVRLNSNCFGLDRKASMAAS